MAYTTIVSGTNITSSWANANVRDQAVSPFGSTAARTAEITSPIAGMVSTLTTNTSVEGIEVYNSAGQWRKPWNMPWGVVGRALITTDTSATTSTLVTGSSLSIVQVARRIYKYTITGHGFWQSINDGLQVAITNGSGTTYNQYNMMPFGNSTTYAQAFGFSHYEVAASSATVTRDLRVNRFYGPSGNVIFVADATRIGSFIIEDIGPSGAPA